MRVSSDVCLPAPHAVVTLSQSLITPAREAANALLPRQERLTPVTHSQDADAAGVSLESSSAAKNGHPTRPQGTLRNRHGAPSDRPRHAPLEKACWVCPFLSPYFWSLWVEEQKSTDLRVKSSLSSSQRPLGLGLITWRPTPNSSIAPYLSMK